MDLSRFPRRRYTSTATPIEPLPRFSAALAASCRGGRGPEVWIKRDDLLGLSPGGNKTRKLEFLVADALAQGADTLITCGAPQSNHCRITLAADSGRAKVHVDPSHWSGILYLSRPEDCRGGTEFFRHRATGTERAPYNDEEAARYGYPSAKEMVDRIITDDGKDESKWEMAMRIPMRFNRLILLRPWLWHTAGENFGDTLENGRLVYLMFFRSLRA